MIAAAAFALPAQNVIPYPLPNQQEPPRRFVGPPSSPQTPAATQPAPQASTLPATGPTAAPIANVTATPPATPAKRAQRATVSYSDGMLSVGANDSSLNQILREVARQTGMTVSGGVAEERVFGQYGPADPSTLLTTLLDGTNTNVLIVEAADDRPAKLVLTPRTAGPTPPSPTSNDYAEYDAPQNSGSQEPPHPPVRTGEPLPPSGSRGYSQAPVAQANTGSSGSPPSIAQPVNNVLGSPQNQTPTASQIPTTNSVPISSLPTPTTTTETQQGIVDTPNPPQPGGVNSLSPQAVQEQTEQDSTTSGSTAASSTPVSGDSTGSTSAGGALTPEQVLQKLQQMQQPQTTSQPPPQ